MNLDDSIDAILKIDVERLRLLERWRRKGRAECGFQADSGDEKGRTGHHGIDGADESSIRRDQGIRCRAGRVGRKAKKELMLSLPNLPDEDVVAGGKEQNVPLHYFKEKPVFDFP